MKKEMTREVKLSKNQNKKIRNISEKMFDGHGKEDEEGCPTAEK